MPSRSIFHFGRFTLDVRERRLLRGADTIRLPPKAYEVLVALVSEPGRLLAKAALLDRVWPDTHVEEGILTVHVATLRKALGDTARMPVYIETVARSGYRFVAAVTVEAVDGPKQPICLQLRPVELYELVGRGRSRLLSGSYLELPRAEAAFRAAIDVDSTYAPAHAGLALTRCSQAALRASPYVEALTEGEASARYALALDSGCADAYVAVGTVLFLRHWDWPSAEHTFRGALAINPSHTEALLQYGSLLEAAGQTDQGLQLKLQALARDSQSALVLVQIAMSYWHQRKYDETVAWARRALEVDPRHLHAGEFLGSVYWMLGDIDRFVAEKLKRVTIFGVPDEKIARVKRVAAALKRAHATGGAPAVAQLLVDHVIGSQGREIGELQQISAHLAVLSGAAGRLDDAFDYLERAIALRDPALVHLAVAPQWDCLRGDPRFDACVKRVAVAAAA